MITNRRNKECITFHLSYSYLLVQEVFLLKVVILEKMAYLVKMEGMAINRQNHHIVNKKSNNMAKGPF